MASNRYQLLDSDEYRLPQGMQRVGYDADTQTYTYQDAGGQYWEGEGGNRFGELHRVGAATPSNSGKTRSESSSDDWRYIAPFALLIGAFLLLVFWLANVDPQETCGNAMRINKVVAGESCWQIATDNGMTLQELQEANPSVDCDKLLPGTAICLSTE